MKNYKYIIPVAMIFLIIISWYTLIKERTDTKAEYDKYLNEARENAVKGITKTALQKYRQVLEMKKSSDVYLEVVEFLKSKSDERKKYLNWSEEFFEEYPTDARAYDNLLSIYLEDENYEDCYELFDVADKRKVKSEYIEEVKESIKYKYEIEYKSYDDVGIYSNSFCQVCSDGLWGYVNRYGNMKIGCSFQSVGVFTKSELAPVINQKGEAFFIDREGDVATAKNDKYTEYGMYVEDLIAAKRKDGKYEYVDSNFDMILQEYDYASTFNYGIAAVRIGDKWNLINSKGENISGKDYADIKLDEKQISYRNERAFVAIEQGRYIMVDGNGTQVGNLEFEDATVFAGESPTSVKINGKWRFINKNGELISEKEYNDAHAFSNGLAAVCIGDKWGFIDESEEVVIEPEFYDTKDFNEKGSCFIYNGASWRLLKLYRLNR